ncbi:MAG: glycosyltransferase [Thermodesulforhabdaceae bacterium]
MGSTEKPFLLVQIDPPTKELCGDHYYRTYVPLFALGNSSPYFYTISLTNEHRLRNYLLLTADVVVLNLVGDPDIVPYVMMRRKRKLVTVYEWNDDIYNIPPWNPQYRFFTQPHARKTIEQLAQIADAVQFSSPILKENYGWLNKRHAIFVNHLLTVPDMQKSWQENSTLEIGYGGSAGHFYDVASIAQDISDWIKGKKNVRLNIMAAKPIVDLFSSVPSSQLRTFPTGSIFEYYDFLKQLHIGLAPLLDTPFNRSRSDVKFLEYASHGVVPVLQKTPPYSDIVKHGETGLLFNNSRECIEILENLLNNPEKIKQIAQNARNYILRERMMFQHIKERERFYLELIEDLQLNRRKDRKADRDFFKIKNVEGAVSLGDYVMLTPSRFEIAIRYGLSALAEGNLNEARYYFFLASELDKKSYLPYLYQAECVTDKDEKSKLLREAIKKNPHSVMARWMLTNLTKTKLTDKK